MYRKLSTIFTLSLLASGCMSTGEDASSAESRSSALHDTQYADMSAVNDSYSYQSAEQHQPGENQALNLTVRQMAQRLLSSLKYVNETTPVAVTTLANLNSDLSEGSVLANVIGEKLMHEFYGAGIPVIEFKMTDYIKITPDGDFALTRDYLELSGDLPIHYILTGSIAERDSGYMVNLRVVGMRSKALVGSAQGFIPQYMVQDLAQPAGYMDGVKIQ